VTSYMTNPMRTSAPLPDGMEVKYADPVRVRAEIARASTELMWALDRQRQAWDQMAAMKAEADGRGSSWFMDNSRPWKLATGEVTWWRGEVNSRANALSSLVQFAAYLDARPALRRHD
jgi:hypothetical protein